MTFTKIQWAWVASVTVGAVVITICSLLFRHLSISWQTSIILAIMISLVPPSIAYRSEARRKDLIDDSLPMFLSTVAEAGMTGMTLTRAIEVSAERDFGPLTEEIRKTVGQISWGIPLEKTLQSLGERCRTPLAKWVSLMIDEANRTGGNISETMNLLSTYIRDLQNLEKRKRTQIRPQLAVVYISYFVFLMIIVLLLTRFFVTLSSADILGRGGMVRPEDMKQTFFYMMSIQALFGGLIAGKMSSGTLGSGLKHIVILMFVDILVFRFV